MWQRFTERARHVILLAQEEAGKMSSGHVGTEHLLLGLTRENEGVAAQIFQKMGVSLGKVRQEIEAEVQPGTDPSSSEPKLTPKARRVLELAADEARRMRHNYIGTEHLLLALTRERDGLAAIVLKRLGVELEKARVLVLNYLNEEAISPDERDSIPETPRQRQKLSGALSAMLMAYLQDESLPSVQILKESGLDLEAMRRRLSARVNEDAAIMLSALLRDEDMPETKLLRECGLDLEAATRKLEKHAQNPGVEPRDEPTESV